MTQIILTFIIGVLASFIGAIVGSGGLISIPFLMFLGLPPQIAIATNKFGAVGLSIGSITKFKKEKKIIWKYILPFSILAIIGGIIGAKLLINIDEDYLSKIVGLILLILLPFIFLKKDLGIKNKKPSKQMKIIGSIIYFLLMIFGGFFGGGAGALIITTLIYFFGFKIIFNRPGGINSVKIPKIKNIDELTKIPFKISKSKTVYLSPKIPAIFIFSLFLLLGLSPMILHITGYDENLNNI
ncbi:MAG: sulfite exporter TauE/SafE family protein, partial [Nanoarchaeota archaeon]|nr:sulfite exporter TauE/SafE family protein [Nanoarchaeota archaeon]